jgi:import inner membrane translocase subunit TIM9
MNNLQDLNPEQQQQLMQQLEAVQVKDTMMMYNRLVERCFTTCVVNYRSKDLSSSEKKCLGRCTNKFMLHSKRVGLRFAEYQYEQSQVPPK